MTEREIYERIAIKGNCHDISCTRNLYQSTSAKISCPFNAQCDWETNVARAQAWLDAHKENKMEQKYGKVIFDPRTEEAKALVGKEVEGANCFNFEHNVTHGKLIMNDGSMTMPDVFPFIIGGYKFTFIRAIEPPKKPSYRPFTDEELKGLYGKTLFDPEGYPNTVTGYKSYGNEVEVCVGLSIRSSSALFEKYTLDGHKCGVLV